MKVAVVEFKMNRKVLYKLPEDIIVEKGTKVIVECDRGEDLGEVLYWKEVDNLEQEIKKFRPVYDDKNTNENVENDESVEVAQSSDNVLSVKRIATEEEICKHLELRKKEDEALKICIEQVKNHNLEMKLIGCEYQFDKNKVTFYFVADGRVDFRALVKSLAAIFKTRIELRQIGVRDAAKKIGGIGICGLELCCSKYLKCFNTITLQFAENQQVALNVSKLSGQCGRLLCCLSYEDKIYQELIKEFPEIGKTIYFYDGTEKIKGNVTRHEILRRLFYVEIGENIEYRFSLDSYLECLKNKGSKLYPIKKIIKRNIKESQQDNLEEENIFDSKENVNQNNNNENNISIDSNINEKNDNIKNIIIKKNKQEKNKIDNNNQK